METDPMLKSGYQPQPVAPPSVGLALGLVIGVVMVGWINTWLPEWYYKQTADWAGYQLLDSEKTWVLLLFVGNGLVLRWNTILLWNTKRSPTWQRFALFLALVLHFSSFLFGMLYLVFKDFQTSI